MYYELYNAALMLEKDSSKIQEYHKSKFVPGAELFPFKHVLPFLKPLVKKLGELMKALLHKMLHPISLLGISRLQAAAEKVIRSALAKGYDQMLQDQIDAWAKIWEMSDITIDGDVKGQQGNSFQYFSVKPNLFGKNSRLNIGPKGFTGEKYGGSTYWDTEAYCIPFYIATKDQ